MKQFPVWVCLVVTACVAASMFVCTDLPLVVCVFAVVVVYVMVRLFPFSGGGIFRSEISELRKMNDNLQRELEEMQQKQR
jgi:hypothetical protein